jgi:hypothetical protein
MTIVAYLASIATFTYVGYIFGASMQQIEASEKSTTEAFKEGYIKGYTDCWKAVQEDGEYYAKFPKMGIN